MTIALNKWKAMANDLWGRGVHRNLQQIQDEWKQLSLDFKKIHDYEKKILLGQPNYFSMSPLEKKIIQGDFQGHHLMKPSTKLCWSGFLRFCKLWIPKAFPLDNGMMAPSTSIFSKLL